MKASWRPQKPTLMHALLLSGALSCSSTVDCYDIAWVSLHVHTVDTSGQTFPVETVEYSHNGGFDQEAYPDRPGEYPLWNGGGTYEVTATACWGTQTQTGSYDVPEGPCGADTGEGIATLTLVFEPCDVSSTYYGYGYGYGYGYTY